MIKKLLALVVSVALVAGFFYTSPSVDVSAQEPQEPVESPVYSDPVLTDKDNNDYEIDVSGNKVEIGDTLVATFDQAVKLNRWGGESWVTLSLATTSKILTDSTIIDDKVVWENNLFGIELYGLTKEETSAELGAFEYEVILKEKPLSNSLYFNIDFTPDVEFYYQPPLTQEEIDMGDYRPDNVVGSYAVYSNDKRDHIVGQTNYATGKIGHFYRPRAIDSKGWEVWGELHIDPVAKTMTVTLPQEFIDKAVYPIRHAAGDTFGYTAAGATGSGFEDKVDGSAYTSGVAGTATKMTAWLYGDGYVGKRKCAIYLASDLSAPIANGQTEERTDQLTASKEEYDFAFGTPPNVAGTTSYCLYIWGENVGAPTGSIARDDDAGVDRWYESHVYNGWQSLVASDRTGKFSIYCTYTPGNGVVAPTVVTNAATSVEETTATASGNITATGGANCTDRGFQWDIDTGAPYADNWTENGNYGVGNFTHGLTSLTKGELYYYRALAINSEGAGYGDEVTFLTKPDPPNTFVATGGDGKIDLTWSKGTGTDNTTIYAKQDSYPTGRDDGGATLVYDSTGESYTDNTPANGETWYYRAWSWCTEGGKTQYSDTYDEDYATAVAIPTVVTNAASSIEDTTATASGNITATSENCTDRGFEWDVDLGAPYADNWTENGSFGVGNFTHGLTSLPTGTTIYYRAMAQNAAGWGYGDEVSFLTKPAAPTNVAATDGAHTDKVVITWTKSTGATGYKVYEGANLLDTLGDVATFDDEAAEAGSITNSGNVTASDNTSSVYVTLSLANEATANGASRTYKVVALNGTGDSDDSDTNAGYRGVGAITYQWQMSATDNNSDYSNIDGATTDPYNATEAPEYPAARYFQCIVSSAGASNTPQTSDADRGYRAESGPAPPSTPTNFTLTDLGGITISANWTASDNASSYLMLVNREDYPTGTTGYEIAYSDNATSANLTGYALGTQCFFLPCGHGMITDIRRIILPPLSEMILT